MQNNIVTVSQLDVYYMASYLYIYWYIYFNIQIA